MTTFGVKRSGVGWLAGVVRPRQRDGKPDTYVLRPRHHANPYAALYVAMRAEGSNPPAPVVDRAHAPAAPARPASAQWVEIIRTLRQRGPMTAEELDLALGWPHGTAGRRLGELRTVRRTGEKRATTRGGHAAIWETVQSRRGQ